MQGVPNATIFLRVRTRVSVTPQEINEKDGMKQLQPEHSDPHPHTTRNTYTHPPPSPSVNYLPTPLQVQRRHGCSTSESRPTVGRSGVRVYTRAWLVSSGLFLSSPSQPAILQQRGQPPQSTRLALPRAVPSVQHFAFFAFIRFGRTLVRTVT